MRLCCFIAVDTGFQVAINPGIVTRIHELKGAGTCSIFTNDGHQNLQVRGDFESIVSAIAESLTDKTL